MTDGADGAGGGGSGTFSGRSDACGVCAGGGVGGLTGGCIATCGTSGGGARIFADSGGGAGVSGRTGVCREAVFFFKYAFTRAAKSLNLSCPDSGGQRFLK